MIVTATYGIKLSEEDLEMIAERVVRRTNQDSNKNKLLNITEAAKHWVYLQQRFIGGEKEIKIFRISN